MLEQPSQMIPSGFPKTLLNHSVKRPCSHSCNLRDAKTNIQNVCELYIMIRFVVRMVDQGKKRFRIYLKIIYKKSHAFASNSIKRDNPKGFAFF